MFSYTCKPGQRRAERQERRGGHVAVVLAERRADAALAGAERIDAQHDEPELRRADAPRLHHRVLLRPAPVAVNLQDRRGLLLLRRVGDVEVGGHADAGPRLEGDLLDGVAVALERLAVLLAGRGRTASREARLPPHAANRFFRSSASCFAHSSAVAGGLVVLPQLRGLLPDELEVLLVRRHIVRGGERGRSSDGKSDERVRIATWHHRGKGGMGTV